MLTSFFKRQKGGTVKARSIMGLVGLAFVFVAVIVANDNVYQTQDQVSLSSQRGVASLNPNGLLSHDNTWQKKLAGQLAVSNDLPAAKVGQAPGAIEKFLFGELKGYYLMELKNQKVHEMFLQKNEADDLPRSYGTELTFLENHKDLWWVSYNQLELKERTSEQSIVNLLDPTNKIIGEAHFKWDQSGRLTSFKIDVK